MRKVGAWGLEVALVVALSAAAAGAGEEPPLYNDPAPPARTSTQRKGLLDALFAPKPKPPEKKASSKSDSEATTKTASPSKPANQVDGAVAERRREEAAFLRREAVCDRLLEIAVQTNDQDLLHRAEQLRERSWTAYTERTAHLSGSKAVFESDEQILNKHLGDGNAEGSKNPAPAHTVTGTDRSSHAAVKEVTP
jgi:hypothetical protein